jgi:S-DNA-T family DNA segregation ATPase FtsK/SpoIIIE
MTVERLHGRLPPEVKDARTASEFNLWCAMNGKPYRMARHVWPDGAWEWDVEYQPGRPEGTIAYGTGQEDETFATLAAFAFIAGLEWQENVARLQAEADGDGDGEDDGEGDIVEATTPEAPEAAFAVHHVVQAQDADHAARQGDWVAPSRPVPPPAPVRPAASLGDGRWEEAVRPYAPPSSGLLQAAAASDAEEADERPLAENARQLETVLKNFKVRGEIMEVKAGPVVTLYEFEPVPGVKSSTVINLSDDIARSMSAVTARVAVVPGRSAIGIELPNLERETVYLREMLDSAAYADSPARLPLALGKDIGGAPRVVDLARMPHLLIAGTTGSGKSVGINTMILSLLYRLSPETCRLIMVDPKMLELSVYDGIPHLLTPVVTDPRKAVVALKWAVKEMESRYRSMAALGVRNIEGYNERVAELVARGEQVTRSVQVGFDRDSGEPILEEQIVDLTRLPYIVVVVDEMADLMLVAGKDIEAAIQRLAQMARAAGIHLIMATQRPSVDVITGTIKANFPTRISFQVTSKIDSRTILGEQGAEQLLGAGDMLYMAAGGRITRVHGPFVSDGEVEKVVAHLKSLGVPDYLHAITEEDEVEGEDDGAPAGGGGGAVFDSGAFGDASSDPYDQALAIVMREGKVSVSFIQRHLQIGYNRAARIVERMEQEGIVSPANHVGKRDILVNASDVLAGRE